MLSFIPCLFILVVNCCVISASAQVFEEFSSGSKIYSKIFNVNRDELVTSTMKEDGKHIPKILLYLQNDEHNIVLELELNPHLFPQNHHLSYQLANGGEKTEYFTQTDVNHCHYHGNVRGKPNNLAAISTCNGTRGVVFDEDAILYIEYDFIYQNANIKVNRTCGHTHASPKMNVYHSKNRHTRSLEGPSYANENSNYIELVLVVDNGVYNMMRQNKERIHDYCKELVNIMNTLYRPLNVIVALVGVVIWNIKNEITISVNSSETLDNFIDYRYKTLSKNHPNDNAHLLTAVKFLNHVGLAKVGTMCSSKYSAGVEVYYSTSIAVQATTIAHEMGHNLGMEHDEDSKGCLCPDRSCIMAEVGSNQRFWSSCSIQSVQKSFSRGLNHCLKNIPDQLADSPTCGNGFVEAGEQCDSNSSCCDQEKCLFKGNATCATGKCCDLSTCTLKPSGSVCRAANGECDLPEYCNGISEYCPENVFKRDTELCAQGSSYCYKGSCPSHNQQCQKLWGSYAKSEPICYNQNDRGNEFGNCGYDWATNLYIQCSKKDLKCGRVYCVNVDKDNQYGGKFLGQTLYVDFNPGPRCTGLAFEFGANYTDPGMVPNGVKCGDGAMCFNQKCVSVESLKDKFGIGKDCPGNCSGNGVCNSKGHCHCNPGFAPPLCDTAGHGGSEDSGPSFDHEGSNWSIFIIIFISIVVLLIILGLGYFYRFKLIYFTRGLKIISSLKMPSISTNTLNVEFGALRRNNTKKHIQTIEKVHQTNSHTAVKIPTALKVARPAPPPPPSRPEPATRPIVTLIKSQTTTKPDIPVKKLPKWPPVTTQYLKK